MIKELRKHSSEYETGKKKRSDAINFLSDAYKYAAPHRSGIRSNSGKAEETDSINESQKVYDSSLALALTERVDMIKTEMFPISNRWFNAKKIGGDGDEEERKTMEKVMDQTYACMNGSNLHMELKPILEDFQISTAVWKVGVTDDTKNPLVYTSVPIQQCVLGNQNKFGKITKVFWERPEQTFEDIQDWLPEAKPPMDYDEEENFDEKFKVIEFCVPSFVDWTENGVKIQYYEYYVVDEKFEHIFWSDVLEYNPFIVSRSGKSNDGTLYGKSKVQVVLPNIITLNDLVKKQLIKANYDSNPAVGVMLGGMVGKTAMAQKVQFKAGETTSLPQGSQVFGINTGNDISTSVLTGDNIRRATYDIFVTNPLGTPEESKYRTAEENVLRQQQANKRLAADYGIATYEIAMPLVETTVRALYSIGKFSLPEDFDLYEVKYVNPLTDAQKMQEIESLMSYVSILRSIFGNISPLLVLNDNEVVEGLATRLNVRSDFIKDKDQRERGIQGAMEDMKAQQLTAMQGGMKDGQQP